MGKVPKSTDGKEGIAEGNLNKMETNSVSGEAGSGVMKAIGGNLGRSTASNVRSGRNDGGPGEMQISEGRKQTF